MEVGKKIMLNKIVIIIIFTAIICTRARPPARGKKNHTCPNNASECAPYFLQNNRPSAFNLPSNENQEFMCIVYGNPTPNFTWYKDGVDMNISESRWMAHHLKPITDEGKYMCKACNKLGCISHTIQVNIEKERLKIKTGPKNTTVAVGQPVTFTCTHNDPSGDQITIDWYACTKEKINTKDQTSEQMDKIQSSSTNSETFEIPHVGLENNCWYSCVVFDAKSTVFSSAYLTVTDVPSSNTFSYLVSVVLALLIAALVLFLYHKYRENHPDPLDPINMRNYIRKIVIHEQADSDDLLKSIEVKIERYPAPDYMNCESGNDYEMPLYEIPKDEKWDFPKTCVKIIKGIGEGAFGKVYQAEADGILDPDTKSIVAVKTLKDGFGDENLIDLVSELEIMKVIGKHKNIINLLGCCSGDHLMVIMEYAALGNLQKFLRSHQFPDSNNSSGYAVMGNQLKEPILLGFARQIAEAMEFLASKKCIHRDLAARNVLVTEDYTMKVADFGLARNVRDNEYYRKVTDGAVPIKWMAPESLYRRVYTSQSDVWSFGIVLWEILTMGNAPYPTLSNQEVFRDLKNGLRMDKPDTCSIRTYTLMLECWSYRPEERPNFASIKTQLDELMDNFDEQCTASPRDFDFLSSSDSEEEFIESSLYDAPLVAAC